MKKLEKISTILTRDGFDLHKPKVSREVDRLILERLFGFKRIFRPCDVIDARGERQDGYGTDYYYIPSGKSPRTHMVDAEPVPHFSRFIAATWTIIKKLQTMGVWSNVQSCTNGGVRVEMGRPSEEWEAYALSAPVAICVATVKLLMRDEE